MSSARAPWQPVVRLEKVGERLHTGWGVRQVLWRAHLRCGHVRPYLSGRRANPGEWGATIVDGVAYIHAPGRLTCFVCHPPAPGSQTAKLHHRVSRWVEDAAKVTPVAPTVQDPSA